VDLNANLDNAEERNLLTLPGVKSKPVGCIALILATLAVTLFCHLRIEGEKELYQILVPLNLF